MRLVDTHCHLDFKDFAVDMDQVIARAVSAGVERIIVPGTDLESSRKAVELAGRYPEVFAAVGMHPHDADKADEGVLSALRGLCITSDKVVAVGEVGLDYYRMNSTEENQKKLFRSCLDMARELDLPLILHNREAGEDMLALLKDAFPACMRGVMHCFSGDEGFLKEVLGMGLYVSFTGTVTFDKAQRSRDLVEKLPCEKLLLETDAPYMSPEPLRGRRNEPSNVIYLLDVYAGIYDLSAEDVARITTHNANKLFSLGLHEKIMIAYPIRDSLYLNLTNRCTNRCSFCTREVSNYVKGHNLKLASEPSVEEVIADMGDISNYKEIVFCGFGEPTLRLEAVKKIASFAKKSAKKVRLVTNGEGDLINKRQIAGELKGLVDVVSVSLNAPDVTTYDRICRPVFGPAAFGGILSFIEGCAREGIKVEITCLDFIGPGDVEKTKAMVEKMGASFRLRHLNVVG